MALEHDRRHVLHVNSSASRGTFTDNTPSDFRIRLPERLTLEPAGRWYVCLKQCAVGFSFSKSPLYLCCDLSVDIPCGEIKLPVLRLIHQKKAGLYEPCLYLPVKQREVEEIRFYLLKALDNKPPGFSESSVGTTYLSLELVRKDHEDLS